MMAVVEPDEIAIVVRFSRYEGSAPQQVVALMRAFRSADEADAEAARLNEAVNRNPRLNGKVEYFVKIAKFPAGTGA